MSRPRFVETPRERSRQPTARSCSRALRSALARRAARAGRRRDLRSPTAIVARHSRLRSTRSASTRRCMCWSPATRASATAASNSSRRRASASSARTRRSSRACSTPPTGRAGDADRAARRRDDRDAVAPRSARRIDVDGADRACRPQCRRARGRAGPRAN